MAAAARRQAGPDGVAGQDILRTSQRCNDAPEEIMDAGKD
jgi:hypothetical protein